MIYCFDIDGTLCTNTDGAYENAQPRPESIARVNALYGEGHRIILYTARGSTTGINWQAVTEEQLKGWGVQYHELRFGKPHADVFVDDKAVRITDIPEVPRVSDRASGPTMGASTPRESAGRAVAVIPARSGSKGVPKKNVKVLGGHPLIAYSIAAAKLCPDIERVIVSTDSPEIAEIARAYGAEIPFLRPAHLAQDTSTDLEVIIHALGWLAAHEGVQPALLVQLRPTTPLRDPAQLSAAIQVIRSHAEATSLRSVHELGEPPQKMMGIQDGWLVGLFPNDPRPEYYNLPRQLFPLAYHPNGYVDILRSRLVGSSLYGPRTLAFVTSAAVEVVRPEDFEYLKYLIEKGHPLQQFLTHQALDAVPAGRSRPQ